ncbi:DUF2971 domain-containing protein [Flavobacterium sp. AG291]|uniref:DUF2971 domain-containing protein n=1 Tax=Flavobacterium sp. AG291 TaxID=2184000 RepID=UPI000E0C8B54|nr:DUF2971 domain-containing protein [Flavobacterium sp. AG291]RDI11263.1 DUF2971 family protein [Flavobacterium sp. AG291]
MFKFYSIDKVGLVNQLIGTTASLRLSAAYTFNDPYELKFNLAIDPFAKGQESEYFKVNPNHSAADFSYWQEHVSQNSHYVWFAEQQQRQALAQSFLLSCFSESNYNNLMWSHYTNNYQGICVEYHPDIFDKLRESKGFLGFGKVQYSEQPPLVDSLEDPGSKLMKMVFNKQLEWQYEKEHRLVFQSREEQYFIPVAQKYIKAVYIGSRATKETVDAVLESCRDTGIKIFYAITMGDSYKVGFEEHKEKTIYMRSFF